MRLFAAALATETNTFSPFPTSLDAYKKGVFLRPGSIHKRGRSCARSRSGWRAAGPLPRASPSLRGAASPPNLPAQQTSMTQHDYELMRNEILGQLKAALPVDGVLLGLHGAMVAHGYDDVEADILERVRALGGPTCVISVELYPHCHLTARRVKLADVIVLFEEYPHTDMVERAEDTLDLVLKTVRGQVTPVMSLYDRRQIEGYCTNLQRMRAFVDRIKALEAQDGILSISICHGFDRADVPELGGASELSWTKTKREATRSPSILAKSLSQCGKTLPQIYTIDEGIDAALEFDDAPVVVSDRGDNAGAAAPSDNTTILRCLIERNVENAALGPIWDPIAAQLCFAAGEGTELPLRIGGKIAPSSSAPLDALVTVTGLKSDAWRIIGTTPRHLGDCAAVRLGGVEVVLTSNHVQATGLELFQNVGIDPLAKKLVVVKSMNHFMAAYGPIAKKVIYISRPLQWRRPQMTYKRINHPIWPLDEETSPSLIV